MKYFVQIQLGDHRAEFQLLNRLQSQDTQLNEIDVYELYAPSAENLTLKYAEAPYRHNTLYLYNEPGHLVRASQVHLGRESRREGYININREQLENTGAIISRFDREAAVSLLCNSVKLEDGWDSPLVLLRRIIPLQVQAHLKACGVI